MPREVSRVFFFQAEDGIRDGTVTGVQTCALPILPVAGVALAPDPGSPETAETAEPAGPPGPVDRKSTRLNSSHSSISYAVFCLKKKMAPFRLRHLRALSHSCSRFLVPCLLPVTPR